MATPWVSVHDNIKALKGRDMMRHDDASVEMDQAGWSALSGRILFGNDFPTALPRAGNGLPLSGRPIRRKSSPVF
jgi:hypothetical protein